MNTKYVREVLRITSENDYISYIYWTMEPYIRFYVICSDTFAYACADAEVIEEADLELFEKCLKADDRYGTDLFAAAKRKMMPIPEYFKNTSAEVKELFQKYSK